MIKHVSSVLVLSTLLVGCGGSDSNDKKPPKSSAAVSSSSVAVSSSAPASSVAPSSIAPSSVAVSSSAPASSSSSSGPEVIDAVMTTDVWRGNSDGVVSGSNLGITLVATADGQGAVFDVAAPRLLEGATIEMVVNVSNEYQASGADLQVFAQIKDNASYPGEYDCYTPNAQLTPGTDQVIECVIDESDKKFNQTTFDVQVGIQGKLQSGTIAGTVVIKSAKITLTSSAGTPSSSSSSSSSSSAPQVAGTYIPTSLAGWVVNGGGSPNQMQLEVNTATGSGINMVPIDWSENASANYKYEARFTLPAPINVEVGDVISFTVVVPQSYIDDATAVLQINWHNIAGSGGSKYGGAAGGYRTLSAGGGVSSGVDFVISETVTAQDVLANTDTLGLQISTAPSNTNIKDKILIKSVSIQ